jgi:thiol-disulfide isomerase/thioredoxin
MKVSYLLAALLAGCIGPVLAADNAAGSSSAVDGRWDAQLLNNGPTVDFRLDIVGTGDGLKGVFYDGFKPYDGTTSAKFQQGKLVLKAEHYLTTITATLRDGELFGETVLQGPNYASHYDFHAVRHRDQPAATGRHVPDISGAWELPLETPSSKGERAFRFIVQQEGANVAASILRVDGDTGAYSGTYQNGKWVLSHFDGSRPGVIEVEAQSDGTLAIVAHNEALKRAFEGNERDKGYSEQRFGDATPHYVAYRTAVARARGLPPPDDYLAHTTARSSDEKFTFSFPDVDGKVVSSEDSRFKGKVVLAIVTGTWCPNCHDEAQFLVQLDKQYRDRGLAIVALDFEEPEQQGSLARERAFVKQYGVQYTYLIAGAPAEMWEKVPQLSNLNTWPATVFVGRDGRIKAVHSGFASPASGEFHEQVRREFTARIEALLAERADETVALAATPARRNANWSAGY